MKKAHAEHVGKKIYLLDGTVGNVRKVSEKGYRIKTDDETFTLPLEEMRWLKSGKLKQCEPPEEPEKVAEPDLTDSIMELTNCGERRDGVVVKVLSKRDDGQYNILYSTGCGGTAAEKCLAPLSKGSGLKVVDDTHITCACCGKSFEHKNLRLYFISLREKIMQDALCEGCHKVVMPLLWSFNTEQGTDCKMIEPAEYNPINKFDEPERVIFDNALKSIVSDVVGKFHLNSTISRPVAEDGHVEYTLSFHIPEVAALNDHDNLDEEVGAVGPVVSDEGTEDGAWVEGSDLDLGDIEDAILVQQPEIDPVPTPAKVKPVTKLKKKIATAPKLKTPVRSNGGKK